MFENWQIQSGIIHCSSNTSKQTVPYHIIYIASVRFQHDVGVWNLEIFCTVCWWCWFSKLFRCCFYYTGGELQPYSSSEFRVRSEPAFFFMFVPYSRYWSALFIAISVYYIFDRRAGSLFEGYFLWFHHVSTVFYILRKYCDWSGSSQPAGVCNAVHSDPRMCKWTTYHSSILPRWTY